jgi:spore maturation protein CgeB
MTRIFLPYGEREQFTMRPRTFWSMGAGNVCLVERYPDIQRFFADGQEILLWSTVEEAVERAVYFDRHPDELTAIAQRGHEKVLRQHTVQARLRQLVAAMMATDAQRQAAQSVLDFDTPPEAA